VDVKRVIDRKRAGLNSHISQLGSSLAAKLPANLFASAFGVESYIRALDSTGSPTAEDDLFAGLRGERGS
jgi:hypothetical protein